MKYQTRRQFLKAAGLAAASAGAYLLPGCLDANRTAAKRKSRPNIVFFFTDDQRFDTIRALGNDQTITPTMDSFVRDGTTFSNAYIMGSMSGAVCVPSRAMLMSGKNLFDLVDKGNTIPPENPMLGEVLRKAGYTTFGTGKWHNGKAPFARLFTAGANIFFGGMSDHYSVPVNDFDPTAGYPKENRRRHQGKHSSELFSDSAINFIRDYKGDKPFFVYVSYTAPHDPRTAPKKYHDMYDPAKIALPKNYMPQHPFDNGEMRIRDEKLAPWPRTPDEVRRHVAEYYAMITHVDAQIARVVETLKQTRHAENTIIIFSADNGLAVGRHGLLGKQNLYEHSIHVPLVMCGPSIPKGKKRDGLCYVHDLYPTLCELAGISVPKSVESSSLVPMLKGAKSRIRTTQFFAYKDIQRGVRDQRYKLIEYKVAGRRTTQLFDLEADPWELKNLSDDPKYTRHLHGLRKELLRWKDELGDTSKFWDGYLRRQG